MRETIYRGVSLLDGQWIYGSLVIEKIHRPNWEDLSKIDYTEEYYINKDIDGWSNQYRNIPVYGKTVGQYAGRKDKNGKQVFEGDIVRTKYKEMREYNGEKQEYTMEFVEEVVWSEEFNGFCLKIDIEGIPMYRKFNFVEKVNGIELIEVEVIGNIYYNPMLLKEV